MSNQITMETFDFLVIIYVNLNELKKRKFIFLHVNEIKIKRFEIVKNQSTWAFWSSPSK